MAACCSTITCGLLPILSHPQTRFKAPFLSSNSCLLPTTQFKLPSLQITRHNNSSVPLIFAAQSNFFRAIQTVLKIGRDGIEAGTNLVPEAVPRPIAKLSVGVLASAVTLFVLRSFLSTALFTLGFMGFVYFIYLALSKDKGSKLDDKPGTTDEAIEEARKIMEKYK